MRLSADHVITPPRTLAIFKELGRPHGPELTVREHDWVRQHGLERYMNLLMRRGGAAWTAMDWRSAVLQPAPGVQQRGLKHRATPGIRRLLALGIAAALAASAVGQDPRDDLERGFLSPPDSAKPRTWWHWTMSNVTKEGITKDLEWMQRVGIGGFQLADVNAGRGQTVEPKTPFGTPE